MNIYQIIFIVHLSQIICSVSVIFMCFEACLKTYANLAGQGSTLYSLKVAELLIYY